MEKDINNYININQNSNSIGNIPESKFNKYFFGKAAKHSNKKSTIVGIIDSSGSMCSCWPTLVTEWNSLVLDNFENVKTVIFSSDSRVIEGKYLSQSDVGGGTNICSGFEVAYSLITSMEEEKDFTIVFVSDGDDSGMHTIKQRLQKLPIPKDKNINLICVGVGSGFPTFVGMDLREKYHTGLSSIPAVFLVSNWRTEFASTFNDIKSNYILKLERIKISPSVKRFPWTEETECEIFESSNFLSEVPIVNCHGEELVLLSSNDLSKSRLEEIFKSWTQELQIKSIKSSVRTEASIAVDFMEYLYKQLEDRINSTSSKIEPGKMTVMQRLQLREDKSGTHLLQSLIGECKKIRDGVSLKDLSAEEAAKRLAIGTAQGKFHQQALKMRGLEASEFEKFKVEFLEKLEKAKTKLTPETAQEASFILLQTQKDVFLESDLNCAIQKCNSYELVEVFPMVGHTLLIRRTDQSMINPYTVQVVSIPKINTVCDTLSLMSQGNEMGISIGNDDQEKFNAVLPLFTAKDRDLKHLIRTKLYHLLMTFNVMRNVDTFYYDAYAGLLANTFLRLLKYKDSEWKTNMIDMIYNTFEMIYENNPNFEKSINLLLEEPRGALVTEHKTVSHRCEDITKALLNLLVLKKRGKISEDGCKEVVKYMLYEHIGRTLREGSNVFEAYLGDVKNKEINDFRFKGKTDKGDDHEKDNKKDNEDKNKSSNTLTNSSQVSQQVGEDTSQLIQENSVKSESNVNVIDINSHVESQVIDINSYNPIEEVQQVESLEAIIERFIRNREHIKFDSITDLKKNLKKVFVEFMKNGASAERMNIRLVRDTFNKMGFRINFVVFYDIFDYFCPNYEFDDNLFLICVNHALKYKDSHERSVSTLDEDYNSIYERLKKEHFDKKEKEEKEQLYDSFEKPILESYLKDKSNAMKMVKDFQCTTELLKTNSYYDSNKPFVNVLFFGPHKSGKSSLVGRLMKDQKCIDEKHFDYYRTAYKTFFPSRENDPYEWISNTAVDERCRDKTITINVSHLNLKNVLVNVYDSPGKYEYYKQTISAMALVNHFFLCVEPSLEKINSEIEIIKNSLPSLNRNGCQTLYVILTKCEMYPSFKLEEIENIFADILKKVNMKFKLVFIPVSAYQGNDLDQLVTILSELRNGNQVEDKTSAAKLLVLDTIGDKFGKKIVYVQTLGNSYITNTKFVVYPSLKEGKILSSEVNYQNHNDYIPAGQMHTIRLSDTFDNLQIKRGSILYLNKSLPKLESDQQTVKVKEIEISVGLIGKKIKYKQNSCIKLEFKYFNETMQITKLTDLDGNQIKDSQAVEYRKPVIITLVPTYDLYMENMFSDDKADYVIIRGPHYSIVGIGKILKISYNIRN